MTMAAYVIICYATKSTDTKPTRGKVSGPDVLEGMFGGKQSITYRRGRSFWRVLKHYSPFIAEQGDRIWHENVARKLHQYKQRFCKFGLWHERWEIVRDQRGQRNNRLTNRIIIGMYYPHFKAIDNLNEGFRKPSKKMANVGVKRLSNLELKDFHEMPGRLRNNTYYVVEDIDYTPPTEIEVVDTDSEGEDGDDDNDPDYDDDE